MESDNPVQPNEMRPACPATMSIVEAGKLIGCGKNAAYYLAKTGGLPTIRAGARRLVVSVEGLEKTLTVEVFQGGSTTPFPASFRTRFGAPGAYAADIVPTREGAYRFVVKGTIDTLEVNETFETGPGRFDEIRSITQLQYPDKVPAGAELGRTLDDIRSTADQVRIIAIVALLLAAAAVVLPLLRRRS